MSVMSPDQLHGKHGVVVMLTLVLAAVGSIGIVHGGWLAVAPALVLGLATMAWRFPVVIPGYLVALCLVQPLLFRLLPADSEAWTIAKRLDEFSLAALVPLAALRFAVRGVIPLPRVTAWALGALALIGLYGSWRQGTERNLVALDAFLLFKGFLAYALVVGAPVSDRARRILVRITIVYAGLAALVGILELVAPSVVRTLIPYDRAGVRLGRTALISWFENEGQSAWFFAFFAVATFAFYRVYRSRPALALSVLFTACSLLTLRRKPIGGLAIALGLAVLLTRRDSDRVRVLIVVAALVAGIGIGFGDSIVELASEGYDVYVATRDPTQVARTAMYLASFRIAWDHFPGGVGFGLFGGYASQLSYSPIYVEYGLSNIWGLSPSHDRFLLDAYWPHVLGQFGFAGLVCLLLAMAGIWVPLVRHAVRDPGKERAAFALAAVLTFVEAGAESIASPVFETTASTFLVFILAALASSPRAPAGDAPS